MFSSEYLVLLVANVSIMSPLTRQQCVVVKLHSLRGVTRVKAASSWYVPAVNIFQQA